LIEGELMKKTIKAYSILADDKGTAWAEGVFTQARINSLIKAYKRAGINLTAHGSPVQLVDQLEQINAVLDTNATARAMREQGRLVVMGVGF